MKKRKVMDEYAKGNIDILISTTVIEVGVDVKNATVMVILMLIDLDFLRFIN